MELILDVATIADRKEKNSSRVPSKLKLKLNDDATKGVFVEILKGIGDHQLFNQFYESQRVRLKTKGPQGQFLKMDVSKFHAPMKTKLNAHADWDRWLGRLPEVTQIPGPTSAALPV